MLNIGPPELLFILVIALVVVGPQRLPELGRTIGRGLREFRKVQDEVRDMVDTGIGEDFKQTTDEVRKAAADLKGATDVKSAFRNTPHKARQRAAEAVRSATTPDDEAPPAQRDGLAISDAADATEVATDQEPDSTAEPGSPAATNGDGSGDDPHAPPAE
jgi:sec-independent protein translocase protein TatB